jgi:hypothetical protein
MSISRWAGRASAADHLRLIQHGRYLAEHLPDATLVELPGADGPLVWDTPELALDASRSS